MSTFQRYALFQMIVVIATVLAFTVFYLVTRNAQASQACFGLLGLLGVGYWYFRRGGRNPIFDERDQEINRRAAAMGFGTFWIAFVGWGTFLSLRYGEIGTVPLAFVQPAVWLGWILVVGVWSASVLAMAEGPER